MLKSWMLHVLDMMHQTSWPYIDTAIGFVVLESL
jgi:hypothetical protein